MANASRRWDRWRWWLREVVLVVSVLIAGLVIFGRAAEWSAYHGDEGHYLWSARYFDWLFIDHDLTRSDWGDNYYTHTQPMFTRYLLGAWLWARGQHPASIPQEYDRYDHTRSLDENRLAGRVPDAALLAEARTPMVLAAATAVALLYLIGRVLAGAVAGLTAAGLALGSPFVQELMVRATPEAPLACCLLLGLLLGIQGARRHQAGGIGLRWAVPLGIVLGLAAGVKLTGFLSLAAILGWGVFAGGVATLQPGGLVGPRNRLARAGSVARGWCLAVAIALGVFVIGNPHIYSNPLLHTIHLFEQVDQELTEAQVNLPGDAVKQPLDRPGRVLNGSLIEGTLTGSRGYPLEVGLASIGAAALLIVVRRGWRNPAWIAAEGQVLLTVLTYFAGISAGLYLAWPRYYIPTLLLGALCSGVGVAVLLRQLRTSVPRSTVRPRAASDRRTASL